MQIGGPAANPGRDSIAVVRLASPVRELSQLGGKLVSLQRQAAAVQLRDTVTFERDEPLVLVRGERGSRAIARATWVHNSGSVAIFRLATDFQAFDARKDPRLPVQLRVEVLAPGMRGAGLMIDISNGGAAVATVTEPTGHALTLFASNNGFWATLPCTIVGRGRVGACSLLHLQFADLNVAEHAFVRQMIREAQLRLELAAAA